MQAETAEHIITLDRGRAGAISPPTRTAAPPVARRSAGSQPVWELVSEALDLVAGLTVMLLPLVVLSVPGVLLFFVLPGILVGLVGAVLALLGALVIGPPLLVIHAVRRRRARWH